MYCVLEEPTQLVYLQPRSAVGGGDEMSDLLLTHGYFLDEDPKEHADPEAIRAARNPLSMLSSPQQRVCM